MDLHKHLASCDDCRRIFDDYQRIRTGLRELPPSPPPPPELARLVWSETVERTPPSRLRRIIGETTTRVGLTTAAVLAVVIVVSAFLLVRGYNQNLPPSASSNVAKAGQSWPIYQPIEIEFNKPMDHKSVEENLQIWPPGERDRIPMSWRDNTLILGSSSSQSALFLPDTTYQVVVLAGARDAYGHQLEDTFTLSFRTSSIADAARTPTSAPAGTPGSTPTPSQQQPALSTPATSQTTRPPATATSTTAAGQNEQTVAPSVTRPSTPPSQARTPTPQATATPSPTNSTVPPTPTATPASATTPPASAATPSATATSPATPAPTPKATPQPSQATDGATPPVEATPEPASPTPEIIPVTGAFGSVYWANSDVQAKLGAAQAPEAHMSASELGFQRGTMYERFDTGQIYVLYADNQWISLPDTWTAAEGEGGGPAPEDKLWLPSGSFGKVWNSDPEVQQRIGYAVNQSAHVMGGVVQQFANGIMLFSDQGFVYVVYDDGSWTLYPDTSGHGNLITPTPQAGATPISTPAETPEATDPAAAATTEPTSP